MFSTFFYTFLEVEKSRRFFLVLVHPHVIWSASPAHVPPPPYVMISTCSKTVRSVKAHPVCSICLRGPWIELGKPQFPLGYFPAFFLVFRGRLKLYCQTTTRMLEMFNSLLQKYCRVYSHKYTSAKDIIDFTLENVIEATLMTLRLLAFVMCVYPTHFQLYIAALSTIFHKISIYHYKSLFETSHTRSVMELTTFLDS